MTTPIIPSARAPFVDSSGRIQVAWFAFLNNLWERTGGFSDNVSESGTELDVFSPAESAVQSQRMDDADVLQSVGRETSADVQALRQQIADNEILHSMGF